MPQGSEWQYELKLDGYRALALKADGKLQLRSRNDNDFSGKYPAIVRALASLPNEIVVDGDLGNHPKPANDNQLKTGQ